jgi:hypothetical protein
MAKTKMLWLARDVYYNLSSNPMMLEKDYFVPTGKAKVFEYFSAETAKILGLPTLRKGQQGCFRRTPTGWEEVK